MIWDVQNKNGPSCMYVLELFDVFPSFATVKFVFLAWATLQFFEQSGELVRVLAFDIDTIIATLVHCSLKQILHAIRSCLFVYLFYLVRGCLGFG